MQILGLKLKIWQSFGFIRSKFVKIMVFQVKINQSLDFLRSKLIKV